MATNIMHKHQRHAFTLVEMSIVLVIIGLLTGGVLAGRSLIQAAKLNAIATEGTQYVTATRAFRDKYNYLPGDLPNATAFWGLAYDEGKVDLTNGGGSPCWYTPNTTKATCDGDGNGQVNTCAPFPGCLNGINGSKQSGEMFQYWKHLANAGLIGGSYTGVCGDGCANYRDSQPGLNVPASRYTPGGWSVEYLGNWGGDGYTFAGNYGNPLFFGAPTPGGGVYDKTQGAIISPVEAWNIDAKIDDGKPASGKVFTHYTALCSNATSSWEDPNTAVPPSKATYLMTSNTPDCSLIFLQVF